MEQESEGGSYLASHRLHQHLPLGENPPADRTSDYIFKEYIRRGALEAHYRLNQLKTSSKNKK